MANRVGPSHSGVSTSWRTVLAAAEVNQAEIPSDDYSCFGEANADDDGKHVLQAALVGAIKRGVLQPFTHLKLLPEQDMRGLLTAKDRYGADLLTIACLWANKQIVEYLIDELEADIQAAIANTFAVHFDVREYGLSEQYFTAVEAIINNGMLQILAARGANLNAVYRGTTLLLSCDLSYSIKAIENVLQLGADPDVADDSGDTLLITLIKRFPDEENDSVISHLVEHVRVDVNKANKLGHSPLHVAVQNQKLLVTQLLLKRGAKLTKNCNAMTPPMLAANNAWIDGVDFFLDYKLESGVSLLTSDQKADLLELQGCTLLALTITQDLHAYARSDDLLTANLDQVRFCLSLWLQAEHWRRQAGVPEATPSYQSTCAARVLASSSADLPPIGPLHEQDDTTIDNFLQAKTLWNLLVQLLVRRECILGSYLDVNQLFALSKTLSPSQWTLLFKYSLTFPSQSCVYALKHLQARLKEATDWQLLVDLVQVLVDCLVNLGATAQQSFVSALLCAFHDLCFVLLQADHKQSITQSGNSLQLQHFERNVRKVCTRNLRGLHGHTLLHVAVLSYAAKQAFFKNLHSSLDTLAGFESAKRRYGKRTRPMPDAAVIELFVRCGADCNARDDDGNTPLHLLAHEIASFNHLKTSLDSPNESEEEEEEEEEEEDIVANFKLDSVVLQSKVRLLLACRSLKSVLFRALHRGGSGANSSKNFEAFGLHFDLTADREQLDQVESGAWRNDEQFVSLLLLDTQIINETERRCFVLQVLWAAACRTLLQFARADVRNEQGKTFLDVLNDASPLLVEPRSLLSDEWFDKVSSQSQQSHSHSHSHSLASASCDCVLS